MCTLTQIARGARIDTRCVRAQLQSACAVLSSWLMHVDIGMPLYERSKKTLAAAPNAGVQHASAESCTDPPLLGQES